MPTGNLLRDKLHLFPKWFFFLVRSRGHLLKLITEADLVHAFVLFSPVLTFGIVYPKKCEQWKQWWERMPMIKHRWWSIKFLMMIVQTSVFSKSGEQLETNIFDSCAEVHATALNLGATVSHAWYRQLWRLSQFVLSSYCCKDVCLLSKSVIPIINASTKVSHYLK